MKTNRSFPATLLLLATLTLAVRAQDAIPWVQDLGEARRLAEQQQRLVLLHFWGDGCPPCAQLEANVFNQPEFIRVVSTNFVPVKIKVQDQPTIAKYYGIKRIPTDVIVLPTGKEVFRTESPAKANAYIAMLDQVRANAATGLQGLDRVADVARGTVSDAGQQVDRTAQNAMNAANKWSQQGLDAANRWSHKAQTTVDRTAQDANNRANELARNATNAYQQMVPTLPPREGEQPTSEPYNADPLAGTTPDTNQGPTGTDESARSAIVNNQFVGPTDPQAVPQNGGSRYGNPYIGNDAAAGQVAGNANATQPSAPSQPAYSGPAPAQQPYQPNQPMQGYAGNGQANAPANQQYASQQPAVGATPPSGVGQQGSAGAPPANASRFQLPPGHPPLALDGYCPVTLVRQQKWEQGSPQFGAIHRGRTYFFKSEGERAQFLAAGAADQFAPVLSGYDPVRFAELHQTIEGSREHGVIYQNQIYLFADEQALAQFEQQPERYVNVVRQAMANARPTQPQR